MSGVNTQRTLTGVADLSKLTDNKRKKLSKLFKDYDTSQTAYSSKVLGKKETQAKDMRLEGDEMYSTVLRHSQLLAQRYRNKSYKYYDNTRKSEYLSHISSRPEIKEVLTKMCNELVVTHEDASVFAEPQIRDLKLKELGFKDSTITAVQDSLNNNFSDFYKKLGMSRSGSWKIMYEFLKEGKKAWEIIYDNPSNPKKILHFVEIDYNTLEMIYQDGERMWIHTPMSQSDIQNGGMWNSQIDTNTTGKVLLYDHQIIHIDWNDGMIDSEHQSYMEQLIKPYNMMRIIDETRITWAVTNSTFRTLYSIPTANQGRNRSEQTVSTAMEMYKDHYSFDTYSGDVSVNGENNLMMSKDIFMSNGDNGQPEISVLGGEGFDLQSIEPNEMFQKKFYRASGMPNGRFDSGGQETWNLDPTSVYREEIEFGRYISNIREIFSNVLLKPLLYQLVLDIPELHNEPDIPENIFLSYTSYGIFTKLMEQEMLKVQFEFVEQIRNAAGTEMADGSTLPLIPMEFIFKEYGIFDDEKIKLIEKMRIEEVEKNLILEKKIKDTRKKYGIADDFEEDEF